MSQRAIDRVPARPGDRVRARILDSAEALFAERGFFGTSIRDVTDHAQVRLAGVNYHFDTKAALLRAVVVRRADVLNLDRLALLAAIPTRGSRAPRVHAVVGAFVVPVCARAVQSEAWRSYLRLIAQVASSRLWALTLVADHFNPTAGAFVAAFRQIFSRADDRQLQHAYQFMLSATLYAFSDNRRLDSLTQGGLRSDDFSGIASSLIAFASAGVLGLCQGSAVVSGKRPSSRISHAPRSRSLAPLWK